MSEVIFTKNFSELYKTAYSHGLESIYALENVDLSSVRVINSSTATPLKEKECLSAEKTRQLALPFELQFREQLDSFILLEPLDVLGISPHSLRSLMEASITTIGALLRHDFTKLVYFKGLGQGHLDDIKQRLKAYIGEKELYSSDTINFAAWLRAALAPMDRRRSYLLLQPYQLDSLIALSPAESAEVRRMPLEVKRDFISDAKAQLPTVMPYLEKVSAAFITPWMRHRQGIAHGYEIHERLLRKSEDPENARRVIAFITGEINHSKQVQKKSPLAEDLILVEEDLYAVDKTAEQLFNQIKKQALSYFYSKKVEYPLQMLSTYLLKDFVFRHVPVNKENILAVLCSSKGFQLIKKEQIYVRGVHRVS